MRPDARLRDHLRDEIRANLLLRLTGQDGRKLERQQQLARVRLRTAAQAGQVGAAQREAAKLAPEPVKDADPVRRLALLGGGARARHTCGVARRAAAASLGEKGLVGADGVESAHRVRHRRRVAAWSAHLVARHDAQPPGALCELPRERRYERPAHLCVLAANDGVVGRDCPRAIEAQVARVTQPQLLGEKIDQLERREHARHRSVHMQSRAVLGANNGRAIAEPEGARQRGAGN
mmetsp:Transcript_40626/g.121178  ORF Transcript_40626/g.121178 Transcript_40626/m.121178 type:complete len:235 (-) Transcript_40626:5-709(-)